MTMIPPYVPEGPLRIKIIGQEILEKLSQERDITSEGEILETKRIDFSISGKFTPSSLVGHLADKLQIKGAKSEALKEKIDELVSFSN